MELGDKFVEMKDEEEVFSFSHIKRNKSNIQNLKKSIWTLNKSRDYFHMQASSKHDTDPFEDDASQKSTSQILTTIATDPIRDDEPLPTQNVRFFDMQTNTTEYIVQEGPTLVKEE